MRKRLIPAALAAVLLGGTALGSAPAAAQESGQFNERSSGAQGWRNSDMDRSGREQFERGFRQGREDERRRQTERQGQSQGQASRQDRDHYIVIPNYYPESVPFQRSVIMPDYSRSMDLLLVAAQSLREAMQAIAQQPVSEGRNQAMQRAQDAILETQQAMLRLPPELRTR